MTFERRVSNLEQALIPPTDAPIHVKVCRVPPESEVPLAERDAWIAAHPECISKIIEIIPGQASRVIFETRMPTDHAETRISEGAR